MSHDVRWLSLYVVACYIRDILQTPIDENNCVQNRIISDLESRLYGLVSGKSLLTALLPTSLWQGYMFISGLRDLENSAPIIVNGNDRAAPFCISQL